MDIHDGNTFLLNGTYYYYGASYGDCKEPAGPSGCADAGKGQCGFRSDHNVSLYTSDDLESWKFNGHVFQMGNQKTPGILFCPKVLWNPKTELWVLWFNYIPETGSFADSYYAVATSTNAAGPFLVINWNITLGYSNMGDFSLFMDDDFTAYVIYTSHIQGYTVDHQMSIERLNPDFLSSEGLQANSGFFGASGVEAPAFFKRNGIYYAVFGACCCYCQQGSPVTVYTAAQPLGPYTTQNSLGSNIPAQQTNILQFASPSGWQYLWQGDRWQSAPDGIKGHDLSYWGPLDFDSVGNIAQLQFQKEISINVSTSVQEKRSAN
eukprot:TRINITY_DN8657_c0_g1_i1.p2 TRINITY_DN8657_c0_g1~~TRINITY_DN8657_c0_g1_i1.p2  ORF type:complete len:321 (-),score=32.44 TRINITY_DN8657_c0_g1_i1:47-1009(-)